MQPTFELIIYPIDLSEFGKIPSGDAQFRIVRASSRIDKLSFQGKIHTLPRYAEHGHKWILERWLPPERLIGKTREEYEEMFRSGPMFGQAQMEYPIAGDYEYVYHFDELVDPIYARKIASMILYDEQNSTPQERIDALLKAEERKAEEISNLQSEKIGEIMTRTPEKPWSAPVSSLPAKPRVLLTKENA